MSRAVQCFFPEGKLLAHDWHDWIRDPWSSGTWVSHGLGREPLFAGAESAAKGRRHFATSDIASRESGWFEGAIISCEAAAEAILVALLEFRDLRPKPSRGRSSSQLHKK